MERSSLSTSSPRALLSIMMSVMVIVGYGGLCGATLRGRGLSSTSTPSRASRQYTQKYTYNHAFFLLFPFRPRKVWGRIEDIFQNGPCKYLKS